jgi:NADH dehydrogenase [ubiquinone] 1 alpha subcomplex assembly factor 1
VAVLLHFTAADNHPVTQSDDTLLLFNFSDPAIVNDWAPIDDRVMGGISRSRLRYDPAGHAVFEGTVSLEHNGSFASVRSSPAARGLPGAAACVIEIRGDNKQFKLSLLTDDGFDSLNYQASVTPSGTDWQTLHLPLATFRASFRGREVPGPPALDPARNRQVGLMIADRRTGPFALEIKRIRLA